jgi:predicted double-glycine peptidase
MIPVIRRFPVTIQAVSLDSYRETLNYRHNRLSSTPRTVIEVIEVIEVTKLTNITEVVMATQASQVFMSTPTRAAISATKPHFYPAFDAAGTIMLAWSGHWPVG